MRHKVKITVLKRFSPLEIFENWQVTSLEPLEACHRLRDGQHFVVDEDGNMPEGFCPSAWISIYPNVRVLRFGGDLPWFREKGVAINCCTDGLRPVIFMLERI